MIFSWCWCDNDPDDDFGGRERGVITVTERFRWTTACVAIAPGRVDAGITKNCSSYLLSRLQLLDWYAEIVVDTDRDALVSDGFHARRHRQDGADEESNTGKNSDASGHRHPLFRSGSPGIS